MSAASSTYGSPQKQKTVRKNTPSIKVTAIKGANEFEEEGSSVERDDVAT